MTYSTIMVNLEAGRSNTHLLQVAKQFAERFQAGVIGSTACSPIQLIYGDGSGYGDVLEQDAKEIQQEINVAEAEFRDAMGNQPRFLDWQSAVLVTPLSGYLARAAARADLILTDGGTPGSKNFARQIDTGELVIQAGRPVLVVAPGTTPFGADRIVIGWKDTREARRAVADALPLLKKAKAVSLIEITTEDDLEAARDRLNDVAGWLGRHGIAVNMDASVAEGDDAGWFESMVAERDAEIVVAGAYGHSRMREWALGGVTRSLLNQTLRSCLVSH